MTIDGAFDTNKFWKLRKNHNKKEQSSTSVIKNGVEVFSPDQIKRAFKEEFQERLERPRIDDKISRLEERTNLILDRNLWMGTMKSVSHFQMKS